MWVSLIIGFFLFVITWLWGKLFDVMLRFANTMEEFGKIIIEYSLHALNQELLLDIKSLHKLTQFIIRLELLLALTLWSISLFLRLRLRKHKKYIYASLWILLFNVFNELINLHLSLSFKLKSMLFYNIFSSNHKVVWSKSWIWYLKRLRPLQVKSTLHGGYFG